MVTLLEERKGNKEREQGRERIAVSGRVSTPVVMITLRMRHGRRKSRRQE